MSSNKKLAIVILVMVVICGFRPASGAEQIHLKVLAKTDCVDVPVHAVIDLPTPFANVPVDDIDVSLRQTSRGGARIYGMLIPGQIVKGGDNKAELWWVVPQAEAGSANRWTAILKRKEKEEKDTFSWKDTEGQYLDLLFGGRKVTRYMYAYDTSTPERIFETYKPLHHVFDAQGENLLTNGPDGEHTYSKKNQFPHHRGIFIGWNRLEFGGQRFDLWHMSGVAQVHQKFLEMAAGPVLARSSSLINWNDKGGKEMIAEQRHVTVFSQGAPTVLLLEFQSELKAVRGDVFLNGDPEHAGMQYRAHNDVATGGKDVKATYLFHKDGIDAHKDKDLPWAAMSYGLNGKRYSVLYMDYPDNPRPVIYSAYRDYGRFGTFFKKQIKDGDTLKLRYRIWITEGPMPERAKLVGKYAEFVDCPKVEVVK